MIAIVRARKELDLTVPLNPYLTVLNKFDYAIFHLRCKTIRSLKILSYLVALGWIIESVCEYQNVYITWYSKIQKCSYFLSLHFLFVASLLRFGPNPRLNQPSITYHF